MKSLKLKDGLYWTGTLDPGLRVFDIVMMTEFGTTYNSYILKGSEKTALFETSKLKFWDSYKETVEDVVKFTDIDYIIVNHTEPDHAGSIEKIVELNPRIKIVGSGTAISFLKNIVNRDFYSMIVGENDTLSLGDKTLHFMMLPNLHWPDTMYTYVEEDKVLLTCDSFGSHYSHEGILRSTVTDVEGYNRATKYYFDNIIGPYRNPYMTDALERIKDLDISMICTGHGPVLDSHIDEIIETYKEWCKVVPNERKKVVIPYVSAYGYTKQLAEKICEGIKDSGDIDIKMFDMVEEDKAVVAAEINSSDGFLFGTPTIIGEALSPIWELTLGLFGPVHKGKLASAFGSYGWSGEGVPHIIERLKQVKLKVIDGFKIRFKPSNTELMDAYDYGYNFGCILLEKENDRAKSSGGAKLVKCLVCGEIFDASLENCPVCGVGKENFIEVDDTTPTYSNNTQEEYVVIGGGAAAYNAANAIRDRNSTCTITLITEEESLPYNRPMLTKSLLADFSNNQFAISGPEWYEQKDIKVLLGEKVTEIDPRGKTVTTADREIEYDKLIYALGADCFIPPVPGIEQDHVVSIRRIPDVQKIQNMIDGVKSAVVIGGGVLGLEAAWELKKGNCDVTILEFADRILPKQLDESASNLLTEIIEREGLHFFTNAQTKEITPTEVILKDGRQIEAQLVIVSTGIAPNTKVAKDAGLKCERLIEVNKFMQTSDPDIYACGDCAVYDGVSVALWPQAVEMGRVAGANATGDEIEYETYSGGLTLNRMNTSLFAMGDNGSDPEKNYSTVEIKDSKRKNYEKYYFHNNRLSGVILIGDTSKMTELTKAVQKHVPLKDIIK